MNSFVITLTAHALKVLSLDGLQDFLLEHCQGRLLLLGVLLIIFEKTLDLLLCLQLGVQDVLVHQVFLDVVLHNLLLIGLLE